MSYILDALKKSEKQRQRGNVPGVTTVQDVAVPEAGKRPFLRYILFWVVVLGAGLLVWWSLSSHSVKPSRVEQVAVHKQFSQTATPAPEVAPTEVKTPPVNNPPASNTSGRDAGASRLNTADQKYGVRSKGAAAGLTNQVVKSTQEAVSAPTGEKKETQSKGEAEKTLPAEPVLRQSNPVPAPNPAPAVQSAPASSPVEAVIPPPENKIYNLTELPSVVSQGLPQFAVSTHIYSVDPSSRLTRINGQALREGQELSPGLKLEEITSDGVVMRYRNYRFRIALR